MDVSVIMTFHDEGAVAGQGLNAMARSVAAARGAGASCEVVAVLDRGSAATREAIVSSGARLVEVDNGDPSASRNSGLAAATGRLVAFVDGDDYWSEASLARFLRASNGNADEVLRHEWVVSFGACSEGFRQVSSDDPLFDADSLLVFNPYVSSCLARREVFERLPFRPSHFGRTGYGFEDWHWLCEAMADGVAQRVVPGTAFFYRRKADGVMARESGGHAILAPTRLLAPRRGTGSEGVSA